jgi:hypothetical protein
MVSRRTLLAALLAATLATPVLAGSADASPRPVAVCEPCGDAFVHAAGTHDVDVRIERSTATMRVHRNGSATWTVENRLNAPAAAAFRENATLRDSVAAEAIAVHDARLLSTSVDGDAVRLRYRTPDVATAAHGGVLRVDYFRDDPGLRLRTGLGADRLRLVAPEGMVAERGLPGADVSAREMSVSSFDAEGDGPFVTLAPADDPAAPVWSLVAVALPLVGVVGRNLALLVVVPTGVFAAGLAALAWVTDRVAAGDAVGAAATPDRRALVVVALGGLALVHPLSADLVVGGTTPPLFAAGAGAVALGGTLAVPAVRDRLSARRLLGLVMAATVLALAVGVLLRALPLGDLSLHDDADVVTLVLPALPVYVATFTGYAAGRAETRRGVAVAAAAFALVLATTFSVTSQGGSLFFLGVLFGVLGAVAGVVVSVPFFVLGHGLSPPERRDGRSAATATND